MEAGPRLDGVLGGEGGVEEGGVGGGVIPAPRLVGLGVVGLAVGEEGGVGVLCCGWLGGIHLQTIYRVPYWYWKSK